MQLVNTVIIIGGVAIIALLGFGSGGEDDSEDAGIPKECNFTSNPTLPEIKEYPKVLSLLDDELQVWPLPLACKPESFGYSVEEGNSIFDDVDFPSCKKLYPGKHAAKIDLVKNVFVMNCSGKYALGPNDEKFGKQEFTSPLIKYSKPVPLSKEEYAISTCSAESEGFFEIVDYRNRVKPKSLARAKKTLQYEPINIAMVVLDSVSRRSFYRKLNKTVSYLNNLDENVFDFKIHNVMGEYSAESFMPTFFGDLPFSRLEEDEMEGDRFYEKSIWKFMHERGYVTYMASDCCGNDLSAFIGSSPKVDHKIGSFYCAGEKYYNFHNNAKKQRCIGQRNAHKYMLDYLLEFSENYKEVSRFSYIHLNTAHEGSGTVIKTLDDDLVEFLTNLMNRKEKTVLFLMGDHGMRYGSWFTKMDGSHEHRLPLLIMYQSKEMERTQPDSPIYLRHNMNRLTSKFDLHTTLVDLAGKSFFPKNSFNQSKCSTSHRYETYNLFAEAISDNRTCMDVGIPLFWCACMPFEENPDLIDSEETHSLVDEIILKLNEYTISPINTKRTICQKLTKDKILSVSSQSAGIEHYHKFKFNTSQSEKAVFEALVLISDTKIRKRLRDGFGSMAYYFDDKQYMKIMYIKRLDAYAGVCKDLSDMKGIDPMFCICQDIDVIKENEPVIVQELYDKHKVIVSNLTCEQACSQLKLDCDEFAVDLYRHCKDIDEGVCKECKETKGLNFPEYFEGKCRLSDYNTFSCTEERPTEALCFCKKI